MVDYREILRLYHEKCSIRTIADSIHSSHHTVSDTLKAAKEKHIEWPLDDAVTNAQLEEILFPDKYYLLSNYLMPDFERIHKELAKPGDSMEVDWAGNITRLATETRTCGDMALLPHHKLKMITARLRLIIKQGTTMPKPPHCMKENEDFAVLFGLTVLCLRGDHL